MYIPAPFEIKDTQHMYNIMKEFSFATFISNDGDHSVATHLPLLLSEDNQYLYGHFARANSQWKTIEGKNVLTIFHGPHCYISPSWYDTPTAVPTWNYVTVHAYGTIELVDDRNEIVNTMRTLIHKYEAPGSTYNMDVVDENYMEGLYRGIQAFQIRIDRLEGVAKLSQNHPIERQERVIQQLEKSSHSDEKRIAQWMKENVTSIHTK